MSLHFMKIIKIILRTKNKKTENEKNRNKAKNFNFIKKKRKAHRSKKGSKQLIYKR